MAPSAGDATRDAHETKEEAEQPQEAGVEQRETKGLSASDGEESKSGGSAEEEDARRPPRPVRAARSRLVLTDFREYDSSSSPQQRRRGRPKKEKVREKEDAETKGKAKAPVEETLEKPMDRRGRAPREEKKDKTTKGDSKGDNDSPGDYVHVEVGDCVLLDSGDPDDHYVALVSSVQLSQSSDKPTGFTAQWYYKPDDIREEVLASIQGGGIRKNEVFLSPHKDKNSIDAVIGLCNVVHPDEYDEIMSEIARGFREKSNKPYYVCRYKYYPSRSVKKALEELKYDDIRAGLGPQKPKVGEEFQATIPNMLSTKPKATDEPIPWRLARAAGPDKSKQVWSRHAVSAQEFVFRQFRVMLETLRFGIGNVVRYYRGDVKMKGHVRCIVLKYEPSDCIEVCLSTGEVKEMLKSDLCSPLSEDVALKFLYASRFNLSHTAHMCTKHLMDVQRRERDAFKQEVVIFAQVARHEKAKQAAQGDESSNRKRRK